MFDELPTPDSSSDRAQTEDLKSQSSKPSEPPAAQVEVTYFDEHGEIREDPYFYLRGKENPKALAILEAENAHTEQRLLIPTKNLRNTLVNEMVSRIAPESATPAVKLGEYFYYERFVEGAEHPIYARKHGSLEAEEEILFDPNSFVEEYPGLVIESTAVSPNHKLYAYAIDLEGDRNTTIFVKDMESGELIEWAQRRGTSDITWLNSHTLLYLTPDEQHRPAKVFALNLNAKLLALDKLLYEEKDTRFELALDRTEDRQYAVIASDSRATSKRFLIDGEDSASRLITVGGIRDGVKLSSVTHQEGCFLYLTSKDGPNGSVYKIDLATGEESLLLPLSPDLALEKLMATKNFVVLAERSNGLSQVSVIDARDGTRKLINFPDKTYEMRVEPTFDYNRDSVRIQYSSFTTPTTYFDVDLASGTLSKIFERPLPVPVAKGDYIEDRILTKAEDGTLVPISLVYRRDTQLPAPCLVMGYGAYGVSYDAGFNSHTFPLVDRGMVLAIAHVRGGGEGGKAWYDAGRLLNKQNTFSDFIACVEELKTQGIADKDRISFYGGSAGGLLVGAVVNQRPELARAVVLDVPFVDVINTMQDESNPLVGEDKLENGDPAVGEQYRYMRAYSPYDNLGSVSTEMPSTLVALSLNDENVPFHEGLKYAQRLRAVRTDTNPTYVRCIMDTGHAGITGRYAALEEWALIYAFILKELEIAN